MVFHLQAVKFFAKNQDYEENTQQDPASTVLKYHGFTVADSPIHVESVMLGSIGQGDLSRS